MILFRCRCSTCGSCHGWCYRYHFRYRDRCRSTDRGIDRKHYRWDSNDRHRRSNHDLCHN